MGKRFDQVFGTQSARDNHRAAREELESVSSNSREETEEYVDANRRVIAAEQDLPRWRRGPR